MNRTIATSPGLDDITVPMTDQEIAEREAEEATEREALQKSKTAEGAVEQQRQIKEQYAALPVQTRAMFALAKTCAKVAFEEGDIELSTYIIANPFSILPPANGQIPADLASLHAEMVETANEVQEKLS